MSSNAAKVKSWLDDYNREQAREQAMQQGNQIENQAMPLTDVGPWQGVNQKNSATNKRLCVQSTLKTHGNFDRCDGARAKTITSAITQFLVQK